MSIDDRIFDVSSFVDGTDLEEDFDYIIDYVNNVEAHNEELQKENAELRITIKTLTHTVSPFESTIKRTKRGASPYDCSVRRGE